MCMAAVLFGLTFSRNPATSSFSSDDGAYGLEVQTLTAGDGWSVPHALVEVDGDGVTYPYVNSAVTDAGFFPGARHALWSGALALPARAFGPHGMRLLLLVGYVVAVAATVRLSAAAGRPGTGAVALVLAAASPLFFNTLQLWAHTPAAAATAVAMVGGLRVMDRRGGWVPVVTVCAAVAVAAALRGDAALFGVAIAIVVGMSGLRARSLRTVSIGALSLICAVGGYFASGAFGRSVVGSAAAVASGESRATGSGEGRWHGLVHTFFGVNEGNGPWVLLAIAAMLVLVGALLLRAGKEETSAKLIAAAAVVWVVRIVSFGSSTATGLIGAWPLVLLLFGRRWGTYGPGERRLCAVMAFGAIGVAATQYDVGGGANWGGRFLAPALPALAVLIAGSLPAVRTLPDIRRSEVIPAVGALAIVCLLGSWTLDMRVRSNFDGVIGRLSTVESGTPVLTSALHVPRMDWANYPERQWLLIPEGPSGADTMRMLLDRAGIERVAFYLTYPDTAEAVAGRSLDFAETHAGLVSRPTIVELE